MDASLCGVLRAFFADFLSLLSGMKRSVPLSTTVSTCLADMIILLLGLGCRAHLAPAPLPVGETGVARARAARGGGGSPGLHKRISLVRAFVPGGPRGRSGRPPRPVPDLPGLHPCPREGGALSSKQKKGVCAAAKRRPVGSRETGYKGTRRRVSIAPPLGGTRDRVPPASDTSASSREGSTPLAETLRGSVHESPVRRLPHAHKKVSARKLNLTERRRSSRSTLSRSPFELSGRPCE